MDGRLSGSLREAITATKQVAELQQRIADGLERERTLGEYLRDKDEVIAGLREQLRAAEVQHLNDEKLILENATEASRISAELDRRKNS